MKTTTAHVDHGDLIRHAESVLAELASQRELPCKVCGESARLHDVLDFSLTCNKPRMPQGPLGVPVYYHLCDHCGFLFTTFCDRFKPTQWATC